MTEVIDLASRIVKVEQQLQAYEKLHGDELAELWHSLNECKRDLARSLSDSRSTRPAEISVAKTINTP